MVFIWLSDFYIFKTNKNKACGDHYEQRDFTINDFISKPCNEYGCTKSI